MKKALLILSIVFLLTGCGQKAQTEIPTEAVTESSSTEASATEEMAETTESALSSETMVPESEEETLEYSYAAYQVVYNILPEGGEESAVFQGIGPDGGLCWTYETDSYPTAQLDQIFPIGRFEGTYYLVESGTVVGLDVITGQVLFENADFQGAPKKEAMLIDDYGYLYLAGYEGPDFFAMDPQGNTVKKIDSLDENYSHPIRIEQQEEQLIIYMESDSMGNSGNFPCKMDIDWLPQAQG